MMMNIKKLKVPKRIMTMRVISTSVSPGKLKVGKGINITRRLSRFNKATHIHRGSRSRSHSHSRSRSAILPARSWISTVRKSIIIRKPKFPRLHHNKGSSNNKNNNNKNIIIIHNNTSITSNDDQDNRASCVEVKEIASLKEEDVTSIDSAAPPPNDHASNKEDEDEVEDEDEDSNGNNNASTYNNGNDNDEEEPQPQTRPTPETEHDEDREIIRLREEKASVHIQSAFRGHLARRAFRALKSLVKLQAVVRGVCVRRQARMALHCMNTLLRLQVRVRARQLLN